MFWRYYVVDGLSVLLNLVARFLSPVEERGGFLILDPMRETRADFTTLVSDALDLLARSDRIRFNRVRAQIRVVFNGVALIGSEYSPAIRMCTLQLKYFASGNDRETTVKFLASALVKEATFGYLLRRGVLPSRRNLLRFGRVYLTEGQRFLQRLGMRITPWDLERLPRVPSRSDVIAHFIKELHQSPRDREHHEITIKPDSDDGDTRSIGRPRDEP